MYYKKIQELLTFYQQTDPSIYQFLRLCNKDFENFESSFELPALWELEFITPVIKQIDPNLSISLTSHNTILISM